MATYGSGEVIKDFPTYDYKPDAYESHSSCKGWTYLRESPKLQNGLEITGIVLLIIVSGTAIPGTLGIIGGTIGGLIFLAVIPGTLTMPGVIALTAGGGVSGLAALALLLRLVIKNCTCDYRDGIIWEDAPELYSDHEELTDTVALESGDFSDCWTFTQNYNGPMPAYRIGALSNGYVVYYVTESGTPSYLGGPTNGVAYLSAEAARAAVEGRIGHETYLLPLPLDT